VVSWEEGLEETVPAEPVFWGDLCSVPVGECLTVLRGEGEEVRRGD